jgi:hypothetical protein
MLMVRRGRCFIALLGCAWALAAVLGLRLLWSYSARAGETGATPADWPPVSTLTHDQTRPTLLMFIHPMCPCSGASVEELSRLMSRTGQRMKVNVIAVRPVGTPESWESSLLIRSVRALPGVELTFDRSGAEAERFGALTSGHVVLFDRAGRMLFNGGITAARGHSGDNSGEDAIVALVNGGLRVPPEHAAVYGCPLPKNQQP